MTDVSTLEESLTVPPPEVVDDLARLDGDICVLGAGGKVGPSVAGMAARAVQEAGTGTRVYGVARFTDPAARATLERHGVEPVSADLTDDADLAALPDARNVVYMAGVKFGTRGHEHRTWMMNTYLPGRVAQRFRTSRIVAFSTLLVYPLADVTTGGSRETDPPGPVGEYAVSCVGRERVFEHFSRVNGTPVLLFRLGYAIETRYGVLLEIARSVRDGVPIPLEMGHVSVISQRDVAAYALRSLHLASSPPRALNITGPEIVSVRRLAERFGEILGRAPVFEGTESGTAYVMDGTQLQREFGFPGTTLAEMVSDVARWVVRSGPTIGKPTMFQQRDGVF
ncbi:NAD(P)-dependent oxidoreductase [Pseudonocardia nematodicida]|uniref:NAD(P)-dependent oxidoreductase n=1 Tax=Pseudonocardia nematodicida TaxID=1206997 RepID=A0ABV1K8V3_9PSEU